MPKNIKNKHIERMFPFDFYNELSDNLTSHVMLNPAFILKSKNDKMTDKQRRDLYAQQLVSNRDINEQLSQANILEVEPLGEVLALQPCATTEHLESIISEEEQAKDQPMTILVVQLYDSSEKPIFSADVDEETIENMPEILWDDPNLLIAAVQFLPEGAEVGIIKIPTYIESKIVEPVVDSPDASDEA